LGCWQHSSFAPRRAAPVPSGSTPGEWSFRHLPHGMALKQILLLASLLLAVGAWSATVDLAANPAGDSQTLQSEIEWVRTMQGWERPASWQPAPPTEGPLHPVVVAGFIALAGVLALVAPAGPERQ
jgi:hypothetical protein